VTGGICDHPGVVMKPITAVLMTSLVLGACEKSNDITQLHEQAISVAKYFGPRVDDLAKRRDAIFQRGRNVPGNLPDVPEIVKLIGESSDKIKEMQGIASPGPDGKSAIEKQADGFLKDAKPDELGKLIDDSQEKLDEDWTIANDDLNKVEGWLWAYEQGHAVVPPSAPPPPSPNNTTEAAPAVGSAATPAEGQPKAEDNKAAEPAKADDQKAGEPAKADDKKAGEPKAADKKAGAPAKADDKKAAAPKADDKKAAPKAAAPKADDKKATPKAGSGSAAK
jgi:hypothetical protein